jgi:hypothetical protein
MDIKFTISRISLKIVAVVFLLLMVSCGSVMKMVMGIPALEVYNQEDIKLHINTLPAAPNIIDVLPTGVPSEDEIKMMVYESIMQKIT